MAKTHAQNTGGAGVGLLAGTALVSGAGGTTLTTCSSTDKTFYCSFVRFFGILKMVVFFIMLLALIWFLWKVSRK